MAFKIGIIGGGVSGLSCALRVQELVSGAEIHILESSHRVGGLIGTSLKDGFVMELGPDCFLNEKAWLPDWLEKIGLKPSLIGTSLKKRQSLIYKNGKLNPMPKGFYLLSPTSLGSLLRTDVISWGGKLRMAMEFFVPKRRDESDESVSDFILRRFGKEALVKIGQPMVGGIYTADPARLSMRAAMPKFYRMEQEYGSLIRAFSIRKKQAAEKEASGPRYSLFASFQNGMEELIQSLRNHLSSAKIRTDFTVKSLRRSGEVWHVQSESGESQNFDAVCLAVPAHRAAAILKQAAPEVSTNLEKIPYESAVIINLAYDTKNIPPLPAGFGVVVPEKENRKIVGLTFCHQKFDGRAPEEKALIRVFMGGAFQRDLLDKNDADLITLAKEELKIILKIQSEPLWTNLRRYPKAMPQYEIGHLEKIESVFKEMEKYPGLFLAGNAYHGVGIPEAIERAGKTGEAISSYLKNFKKSVPIDHILLVGFGGPEKPEDVWPFLLEVTKGTNIPEVRLKSVEHHYELVGGKSLYNEYTRDLAGKIKEVNAGKGINLPVYIGMKNWNPFMRNTIAEIKKNGHKRGLAVVLAPHRSDASWEKYLRCVNENLKEAGAENDLSYEYLKPWYDNRNFTGAQADEMSTVLRTLTSEEKNGLHVIFSAHSIPVEMAERSSYVQEFQSSSRLVAEELGLDSWEIAYQSRSGNPRQPWLEPEVCSLFDKVKADGKKGVMVVPVGFWCDNVEVLFDLDIEAKAEAEKKGLKFWRVPTVGHHPKFSELFSQMLESRLKEI